MKAEAGSGPGQEAGDPCTGRGTRPRLCTGVWLPSRCPGATAPRGRLRAGELNEPSSCSGGQLLPVLPCQALLEPAGAPGWVAVEGGSLTTETGGSETEPGPPCSPPLLPTTPRHGSSAGTRWTRRGGVSGAGGLSCGITKDLRVETNVLLQGVWLRRASVGTAHPASTWTPAADPRLQLTRQALRAQECLQQITVRAGGEQQPECRQGSNQVWGDHREEDRPPHASGNTARPEAGSSQRGRAGGEAQARERSDCRCGEPRHWAGQRKDAGESGLQVQRGNKRLGSRWEGKRTRSKR